MTEREAYRPLLRNAIASLETDSLWGYPSMNFSELENVECFRCGAPRWIHGRSDWFCEEFVDPNSVEAVYDEWGVNGEVSAISH